MDRGGGSNFPGRGDSKVIPHQAAIQSPPHRLKAGQRGGLPTSEPKMGNLPAAAGDSSILWTLVAGGAYNGP